MCYQFGWLLTATRRLVVGLAKIGIRALADRNFKLLCWSLWGLSEAWPGLHYI
jgi:hypothetical protein